MLILLHILYIYTEYLWSCVVNRTRFLNREVNSLEAQEIKTKNVANQEESEFLASSKESQCGIDNVRSDNIVPSDNLESDSDSSVGRFKFHDLFEEFDGAAYDKDTKKIKFFPPVYVQRYVTAVNVLKDPRWKNDIKKVIDIGCSELGFFKFLKDVDGIEKILEIDIDKKVLQEYSYRIQPWLSDYLKDRKCPLEVTILCGNVSLPDRHLEGVDAVIAIELIEHLFPPDLDALPLNIFGVIKPRIAIFTTPNEEFNVLFDNFSGFRHDDHKFEWNRNEFESWAKNICCRFKNYEVNFFGIGPGPEGSDELGCCSQGAVFIRTNSLLDENYLSKPLSDYLEYEIIDHVDYPYRRDERSQDKITFDDAQNFINLAIQIGDYHNGERIEIPLATVLMRVNQTCKSVDKLKQILEEDSDYKVEKDKDGDYIVVVPDHCFHSEEEYDENFESEEADISFVERVVGVNDIVSDDWDSVGKDDVSWNTKNNTQLDYSNDIDIDNCEIDDYLNERKVDVSDEICSKVAVNDTELNLKRYISNNDEVLQDDVGLDGAINNYALERINCEASFDFSFPQNQCDAVNFDTNKSDFREIEKSVDSIDELVNSISAITLSDSSQVFRPLKPSSKFFSTEECCGYDKDINTSNHNYSRDVRIKQFDSDTKEQEIKSTILCLCAGKSSIPLKKSSFKNLSEGFVVSNNDSDVNSFHDTDSAYAITRFLSESYLGSPEQNFSSRCDKNFSNSVDNKFGMNLDDDDDVDEKYKLCYKNYDILPSDTQKTIRHISGEVIKEDTLSGQLPPITNKIETMENGCKNSLLQNKQASKESALSVSSAYEIEACIDSVQEKIKKFDIDCFSNKKTKVCGEFSSMIDSNCKLVDKEIAQFNEKISLADYNDKQFNNSNVSHLINSDDTKSLTDTKEFMVNDKVPVNLCGYTCGSIGNDSYGKGDDVFHSKNSKFISEVKNEYDPDFVENSVHSIENKTIGCNKKTDELKLHVSNTTTSTSCSSGIETVSYSENSAGRNIFKPSPRDETPSNVQCCSFEEGTSLGKYSDTGINSNLDCKNSDKCSYDFTGKFCAYYCMNCTSLSSNFLSMSKEVANEFNESNKTKQCDESSNANISDYKKNEDFSGFDEHNFSSKSFLNCYQNEEVVTTHYYEKDKYSGEKMDSTSNNSVCNFDKSATDEYCGNNDKNAFKVSAKSYDGMFRSHSLGHVAQFTGHNDDCYKFVKPSISNLSQDVSSLSNVHGGLHQQLDVERQSFTECISREDDGEFFSDVLPSGIERQDSFSPDKAGDSGYPNSNSGHDMEMDLTPEQVKEIMTEGESSLESSPLDSPIEEAAAAIMQHAPIVHLGDNVENGDVANNNRDGEGNNMIGQAVIVGEPLEFHALIEHPQDMPLMAAAELNVRKCRVNDCNDKVDDCGCDDNENHESDSNLQNKSEDSEFGSNIEQKSTFVIDKSSPSCSLPMESKKMIKRSKTFSDQPSSLKLVHSNNACFDKIESNSNSCPDSNLKLSDDETEIGSITYCSSLQSISAIKHWEGFKMVESYDISDLKKYAEWISQKSCATYSCNNSLSANASDSSSVPSCSISDCSPSTVILSNSREHNFSQLPQSNTEISAASESTDTDVINFSLPQDIATIPVSVFDNALDSVLLEIIDDILSPENSEPFADWLLQIQVELITVGDTEGEQFPAVSDANVANTPGVNDVESNDSEREYTVEADVKGGGDNTVDE